MLAAIQHRGPDGLGVYLAAGVGLGNARLSIIDLASGDQPIGNEDGTVWLVFNGEIYNYVELRPALEARGHRFSTNTDTEVLVHLYEEQGPACLQSLNGPFAIALWDGRDQSLFLARDRLGVRPLFYTIHDGRLLFGSEIKALLAYPGLQPEIDPGALEQIFTFWSTLSPRTAFRGIFDLPPGHYMRVRGGQCDVQQYWVLDFAAESELDHTRRPECFLEELESLLIDATRLRLRADVPVGAYLSGGLDSSTTTAIIRNYTTNRLDTFSIAFVDDAQFDESRWQQQVAGFLGTDHHIVHCTHADIGRVFPDVIWYAETPILRTAPAPMFLLSGLVHDHGLKVVLTGEGADEFLAGYDLFKEAQVRRFWARVPESKLRPALLKRLYPDITQLGASGDAMLAAFFRKGLSDTSSPYYSHAIRWENTGRLRRFLASYDPQSGTYERPPVPPAFFTWPPLAQAQYWEITIFLSQYLLSSQGDRVAMAHAIEGRFPFLDHRVAEFSNRLPPGLKLQGLTEKWLLKQLGRKLLPAEIWRRPKRPYRAPIHRSFFHKGAPDYVRELLSERRLEESGLFRPAVVTRLVDKVASGMGLSETEDMALAGILSAQLVYQQFIQDFRVPVPREDERVKVVVQ